MLAELAPLVTLLPLAVTVLLLGALLAGRSLPEGPVSGLVIGSATLSSLLALALLLTSWASGPVDVDLGSWLHTDALTVRLGWTFTPLTAAWAAASSGLVAVSTWFARPYVHREPGFLRLHGLLALFATAITLIATASNLVLVFAGWELAGLCSGLLIAYDPTRRAAAQAGLRALLTNRIGDAGLLGAVVVTAGAVGTTEIGQLPGAGPWTALVAAGLVLPALAKSAQLPFTAWLERSVEGLTPTSALFYGGVMSHAGLLLLVRADPVLTTVPALRLVPVLLGGLTAIYATLSGLAQPDVKRRLVLASLAGLSLAMVVAGLGFPGIATALGLANATVFTARILVAPSWLAMRALRPLRPLPAWLVGRPRLQAAASARFDLEARADRVATAVMDGASHMADTFERRVVEPLFGAAVPAVDALAGLVEREEERLELSSEPGDDQRARGVVSGGLHAVSHAVAAMEDLVIARGIGVLLPAGGHRFGSRLADFERLLQHPALIGGVVLVTLGIAALGGGR